MLSIMGIRLIDVAVTELSSVEAMVITRHRDKKAAEGKITSEYVACTFGFK